jgi:hypothetical protein
MHHGCNRQKLPQAASVTRATARVQPPGRPGPSSGRARSARRWQSASDVEIDHLASRLDGEGLAAIAVPYCGVTGRSGPPPRPFALRPRPLGRLAGDELAGRPERRLHHAAGGAEDVAGAAGHAERVVEFAVGQRGNRTPKPRIVDALVAALLPLDYYVPSGARRFSRAVSSSVWLEVQPPPRRLYEASDLGAIRPLRHNTASDPTPHGHIWGTAPIG